MTSLSSRKSWEIFALPIEKHLAKIIQVAPGENYFFSKFWLKKNTEKNNSLPEC